MAILPPGRDPGIPGGKCMKALIFVATTIVVSLGLTPLARAQTGEPSESDILALAERDVARANTPVIEYHQRLGKGDVPPDMLVTLHAARKKGCQPAPEPQAWQCEVQMEMSVPNGGFRSSTVLLRIARNGDGWAASRVR
jgi:hypothetical protein